jgi:hypothetical protein
VNAAGDRRDADVHRRPVERDAHANRGDELASGERRAVDLDVDRAIGDGRRARAQHHGGADPGDSQAHAQT